MMMGCWNFFRQIEKLTLLLFTRHFVNNNHGGGDIPPPWMAVALVMLQITSCFFPDSSRLCSIYDRMSCDFFFYLNTFLTRRSGITFGSFFGNEVIYTTTVMFIKNSLVDLDLIWFEQIWCHWRQTGQKMKKINSFYSEPNVATIPKRFSTFSQKSKKM